VRISAVTALGCFKSTDSIPDVLKALKEPDVHMRWGAVNALMNIRSQDTVEALIDTALYDDDQTVRTRAVFGLTVMGLREVADLLTTCTLNEPADVCRERAKTALHNIQHPGKKEK
jgi:HEAT repeat protein